MSKLKTLFALGTCALTMSVKAADKPNVVFIIADDHTFNALDDMNGDQIFTPNLDRLRKSGAYFTHVFNQGSYAQAISTASRTMLNTGKYLWKACNTTGKLVLKPGSQWPTDTKPFVLQPQPQKTFWSQHMKQAGYGTYIAGKWHVKAPVNRLFDRMLNVRGSMPHTNNNVYAKSNKNPNGRTYDPNVADAWTASNQTLKGYWEGGKHWSEVCADDALTYIDEVTKKKQPYFLYVGFNAPHDPRQSPQEYLDKYKVEDIKIPKSFMPTYPYNKDMGADYGSLRDERLMPSPRTEYAVQVNRREYYSLITHLDAQIGRILDALEKAGQMDNTYIIYTADHGLAVGDHGLAGKQNMYDASLRVPLFISGPGIKPSVNSSMVYLQDAMATVLEIAGSKAVDEVDFKSLLSLAKGAKKSPAQNDAIYGAYMGLQRMVRTEDYKMIIYPTAGVVRLYDLKKDPSEIVDLASEPKYRKTMDELFVTLQKLQKQTHDQLDLAPYYKKFFAKK